MSRRGPINNPELVEMARGLKARGLSDAQIAKHLMIHQCTAKAWTDPAYAAARAERNALRREERRLRRGIAALKSEIRSRKLEKASERTERAP